MPSSEQPSQPPAHDQAEPVPSGDAQETQLASEPDDDGPGGGDGDGDAVADNVEVIDADFSLDFDDADDDADDQDDGRSGPAGRITQHSGPIDGTDGELPDGRVVVIASRYNEAICQSMLDASLETLRKAGVREDNLLVVRVPGAWELPTATALVLEDETVVAVIALGCVIKGETTHDEHINRAVSLGLMELSIDASAPVGFGLLTCNTTEQAIHRSGGNVGNKGAETADAVLEMLRLGEKLRR